MHIFFAFDFSSLVVKKGLGVRVMTSNTTFNNISVILWRFFSLVEETGVSRRNLPTCRKSLTNFIT